MKIDLTFEFLDQDIYVVADDGSWSELVLEGASIDFALEGSTYDSGFVVAFTLEVSQRNFKLFWPGNLPVDLGL